jgi:ribosomal protein S12 methylthiotransferase accessory factor
MHQTTIAERELTAGILAELSHLGLTPVTRTFGRKVLAVQVDLYGNGTHRARGSGKGYAQHARLGALYKALEPGQAELFQFYRMTVMA